MNDLSPLMTCVQRADSYLCHAIHIRRNLYPLARRNSAYTAHTAPQALSQQSESKPAYKTHSDELETSFLFHCIMQRNHLA